MSHSRAKTNVRDQSTAAVTYSTPFGQGWLSFDENGLTEMGLPGTDMPGGLVDSAPEAIGDLAQSLEAYWSGGPLPAVDPELIDRAASTSFMRRIYEVVSSIPRGKTSTYAEVAAAAGRPDAPRSVGAAMARNPFAPMIPCHRVVGSDGSLRGYGGGLDMKRKLLEMEQSSA
jgi:methylated-DNA-[protein]-cysteine S-methyltransferase